MGASCRGSTAESVRGMGSASCSGKACGICARGEEGSASCRGKACGIYASGEEGGASRRGKACGIYAQASAISTALFHHLAVT
ncbi:MAG: hypothetical protein LBR16_05815 [Treponema sp.]|jgi:hypothetical protein|nr:hypothetical protein [Treponema sp.]